MAVTVTDAGLFIYVNADGAGEVALTESMLPFKWGGFRHLGTSGTVAFDINGVSDAYEIPAGTSTRDTFESAKLVTSMTVILGAAGEVYLDKA